MVKKAKRLFIFEYENFKHVIKGRMRREDFTKEGDKILAFKKEDKTSETEESKEKDVSEKEIQRTENVTESMSEPEVVTEQENEPESEDIADMFSSFLG